MILNNNQIKQLGKRIRKCTDKLSDDDLEQLQQFRVSFKQDLLDIFDTLCILSRKISKDSIVTFRLKRFESIINKLIRIHTMQLNTMSDIAGCRCILKEDKQVFELVDLLKSMFIVTNENDYITNPKEDGYKSYHLYLKKNNDSKIIELQIRSQKHHDWATLVEITDLIYDEKIKEHSSDSNLKQLHKILSLDLNELTFSKKIELLNIIKDNNFLETLNNVFSKNQIEIRKQWLNVIHSKKHSYFLLEANKNNPTKINSFNSIEKAEIEYFNKFKEGSDSNILLTHIPNANFKKISIAYSNYILTIHNFFKNFDLILKNIIHELLVNKEFFKFIKYYSYYSKSSSLKVVNLKSQIKQINSDRINDRNKRKEWKKDIEDELNYIFKIFEEYNKMTNQYLPKNIIYKYFINYRLNKIDKKNINKYRLKN